MKITYLTKCPKCGGSIDEEFSKFCPFCGTSLAQNEPMSREERLKMYEYEDQAIPQKSIVINEKSKSNLKMVGIVFLVMGLVFIMMGICCAAFSFAIPMIVTSYGYGTSGDFITELVLVALPLVSFGGIGLVFAVLGIVFLILNGKRSSEYKKIPDNPDEVIEGMVRRFDFQKADNRKQDNYYVYIKVENPKPLILECQYFDLRIKTGLRPEQKVKIYRKGDKYILII